VIIVTGGAGFIGSCIVAKLNELGRDDIFIVDHINNSLKQQNLKNKKYEQYFDRKDFLEMIVNNNLNSGVDCIIHMGACSSTTLQDEEYFEENNFEYTRQLAQWVIKKDVRFIYASSAATYGDGVVGYKDDADTIRRCKPLNLYGQSKQKFDLWTLDNALTDRIVGLKFFNVFGPNEYHKEEMRSVIAKAYQRVVEEGKMKLFKSYKENYADGEQKRDFIYVKDAVDVVMFFLEHPDVNGIFNVGTGKARSWIDLAQALFKAVGKAPQLEYVEMPESLKERYQYFTQADMVKLKNSGYEKPFTSLEDAISDYVLYLETQRRW